MLQQALDKFAFGFGLVGKGGNLVVGSKVFISAKSNPMLSLSFQEACTHKLAWWLFTKAYAP